MMPTRRGRSSTRLTSFRNSTKKCEKAALTNTKTDRLLYNTKKRENTKMSKNSGGRKRLSSTPNADGSVGPRSSKRARLQITPYQSPETNSKLVRIIAATTKPRSPLTTTSPLKTKITVDSITVQQKSLKPKSAFKISHTTPKKSIATPVVYKKSIITKPQLKTKKKLKSTITKGKKSNPTTLKKTAAITKKKKRVPSTAGKTKTPLKPPPSNKRGLKKSATQKQLNEKTKTDSTTMKRKSAKRAADPKPFVTEYTKDPTFESDLPLPSVSSLANSRLLIRAVILGDNKMLEKLIDDETSFCSYNIPRSVRISRVVIDYAIERENLEAVKLLLDKERGKNLASAPDVILTEEITGYNSTMMLGHSVRAVTVGRGGKEGNNAFLKDRGMYNCYANAVISGGDIENALARGVSLHFLHKLTEIDDYYRKTLESDLLTNIVHSVRWGHREVAAELVEKAQTFQGYYGFNQLHVEVLKNTTEPLSPFKAASAAKKSTYNDRITPLHCGAINPNANYLAALLNARPDYNIMDNENWSPIHYAACCEGTGPLALLLSRGISTYLVNKLGETALHLAVSRNREENVKLILVDEEKNNKKSKMDEDEEIPKDILGTLIQRTTKDGKTALMLACEGGHTSIVKLLLSAGADAGKFTPAKFDKLSSLMIAAIEGHLDVVKVLVEFGVKVDAVDLKRRNALTHAVINGQAHIVSYFLRLGAKHLIKDSSGNTLVHYAAAYGWYFCLELVLQAGCPPNEPNEWKMTPLSIAFMKGHIGLVQYLLGKPGVGIDSRIDDSSGATLLLQTLSVEASTEFYPRLRFLIVEQKIDCTVTDFEKNNALHYLVLVEVKEKSRNYTSHRYSRYDPALYGDSETRKCIAQAAKLLCDYKCDPCGLNNKKESPVSLAIKRGCYFLLDDFFDLEFPLPNDVDVEGNTLLHLLAGQATDGQAENVYKKCAKFPEKLQLMKEMSKVYNKAGYTPLLWLLHRVTRKPEGNERRIIDFLSFLIDTLESDVNGVDRKQNSGESVIHLTLRTNYCVEAMKEVILPRGPDLEPLDDNKKTPLATAITSGNKEAALVLLDAGANVNFKLENGNSLLLTHTMIQSTTYGMIPLLIEKGADIFDLDRGTKNSMLHYITSKPNLPFAMDCVKLLIEKGIDVNAVNKDGHTAMHLLVNTRGGETDASYEMENLLLASGAKLNIRDGGGRIPLHMAFVKIGNHFNKSFIDPIELVTILVRAMHDSLENFSEEIKCADEYGYIPLSYAAFRGASISCSYLMMEMGENIDIKDKSGNTPFGLAVLNGHEGCCLQMFQQQGASFTNILNTCLTPRTYSGNRENHWKWKYIQLIDDENEKKEIERQKYPILQEVVRKDWQGILYLMLEKLTNLGTGAVPAISAAVNTNRWKLAKKLVDRARPSELEVKGEETLLHTLAKMKNYFSVDFETVRKIVEILLEKHISPASLDRNQTTALIYASVNRNYNLCSLLGEKLIAMKQQTALKFLDKFGRNPLTALFWSIDEKTEFSEELKLWAESLLVEGVQVNIGCVYPVIVHPFPAVRYLTCETQAINFSSFPKYSPLMMAVIAGNYSIVKWLLTLKNSNLVDVNYQDDDGRTALMYAVILNDIKMVRLILNPKTYDYEKDKDPWIRMDSSRADHGKTLSLEIRDKKGWTLIDHLVVSQNPNYYYANSTEILRILFAARVKINEKSGDGITPLKRAIRLERVLLVETMEELLGLPTEKRTKIQNVSAELFKIYDDEYVSITDFVVDCDHMTKILIDQDNTTSGDKNYMIKPDNLIATDISMYKVIYDKQQKVPFSCVLTQIDFQYGTKGLYNFYKMQLVKETRGKELILLFTRWARVGDTGQYQKTPFGSEEEAIKEFKKIFRAKSGNSWEDQENFVAVPKKFRLVNFEKNHAKRPNQVKVDFEKLKRGAQKQKADLSATVLKLVEDISLVHEHQWKFEAFASEYQTHLPFGNLSYETLRRGEQLLEKIGELIRKRAAQVVETGNTQEATQSFMESILAPSEEFYSLIPMYGFETERLTPVFHESDLRAKQAVIYKLVHIKLASQLLLGAQFNLNKMNPFEYIYRCLNTRMQILNEGEEEAQLILQYIHNTSTSGSKPKVVRIFRVERAGEMKRFQNCGVGNPWLLWHGTSTVNLLSILNRGLKVTPLEATINGHLFGKGIYFSDMFSKSKGYCRESGYYHHLNFIFLSEVALGTIHPVNLSQCNSDRKPMPDNCHSLKTADSRWQTDPAASLIWKGITVPLGCAVETILPEGKSRGLDYNEYIVFKEEQVLLRYLIQFTD